MTYKPRFIPPSKCEQLFSRFVSLDFQKAHLTRSVLWFGPVEYTYGSVRNTTKLPQLSLESNIDINSLATKLSLHLDANFNSCLVNFYADETQTVPRHSDDEPMFGPEPVIASLSFGATRRFVIEPKSKPSKRGKDTQYLKSIKSQYSFCLGDGDLLVMRGPMQQYWNHSVPQESSPCGPRINLTFRNVILK